MAKIIIGNVKGKDGRGITKIVKTASTESADIYTITYTDNTTSTFTINTSNNISLQRQIVPSAAVESSTTASQAYTAGDYVVVSGVLRKVTAAIAKGGAIGDTNSTLTTVSGELNALGKRETINVKNLTSVDVSAVRTGNIVVFSFSSTVELPAWTDYKIASGLPKVFGIERRWPVAIQGKPNNGCVARVTADGNLNIETKAATLAKDWCFCAGVYIAAK
nr:MAG: hypothetical protein [Bacteriophage sp.]